MNHLERVLVMDLKAKMAHFRLPDTTITHASYPFIPRTALHGLLASILGLERLDDSANHDKTAHYVGLRLMARVTSSFHGMSMLGKGWAGSSSDTFNRPVSIEVLCNPYYRVFYVGPYIERLSAMIRANQAMYHTYLGVCYCPVFPKYVSTEDYREIDCSSGEVLSVSSVVPSEAIRRIEPIPGHAYARAGGLHYEHLGNRQFKGTLNMVYEVQGRPLLIHPNPTLDRSRIRFLSLASNEVIAVW